MQTHTAMCPGDGLLAALQAVEDALLLLAEWEGAGDTQPLPASLASCRGLAAVAAVARAAEIAPLRPDPLRPGQWVRLVAISAPTLEAAALAVAELLDPAGAADARDALSAMAAQFGVSPNRLAADAWAALIALGRRVEYGPTGGSLSSAPTAAAAHAVGPIS